MNEEKIWILIARKVSKEATEEELKELDHLFKINPHLQYGCALIEALKESSSENTITEAEEKRMLQKGLAQIDRSLLRKQIKEPVKKRSYRIRRIWLAAASIALLIGIGGGIYVTSRQVSDKTAAIANDHSKVFVADRSSSIVLQDGTKVWLNDGSTLTCNADFGRDKREVTLSGEAFFYVIKDANKPFIVHVKDLMDIKVLGTRFNVKAYPGNPFVEASLVSGKIAVNINNKAHQEVVLKPHQKITVYAADRVTITGDQTLNKKENTLDYHVMEIKPNPVDHSISEISWMDDKLSFNDQSFAELAYDLQRIYHVKIVFKDENLKNYHLTGVFKDETLNEVLQALQITTPFEYTISNKQVIIYH